MARAWGDGGNARKNRKFIDRAPAAEKSVRRVARIAARVLSSAPSSRWSGARVKRACASSREGEKQLCDNDRKTKSLGISPRCRFNFASILLL